MLGINNSDAGCLSTRLFNDSISLFTTPIHTPAFTDVPSDGYDASAEVKTKMEKRPQGNAHELPFNHLPCRWRACLRKARRPRRWQIPAQQNHSISIYRQTTRTSTHPNPHVGAIQHDSAQATTTRRRAPAHIKCLARARAYPMLRRRRRKDRRNDHDLPFNHLQISTSGAVFL